MEKDKIKIQPKDLVKMPIERLIDMKKEMKFHLLKAQLKGRTLGVLGFDLSEERKNIARINTELNRRKKTNDKR